MDTHGLGHQTRQIVTLGSRYRDVVIPRAGWLDREVSVQMVQHGARSRRFKGRQSCRAFRRPLQHDAFNGQFGTSGQSERLQDVSASTATTGGDNASMLVGGNLAKNRQ